METKSMEAVADVLLNRPGECYAEWLNDLHAAVYAAGERTEERGERLAHYLGWLATFVEAGEDEGYPAISRKPTTQGYYVACRMDGVSHSLAEQFATGHAPQLRTDATFLQGFCNGNQFEGEEEAGDYYKQVATEAGVNITGAVYKSGCAEFPGDPRAWVRSRADVEESCRRRGVGCFGSVTVEPAELLEAPAEPRIAPDIVRQRMAQRLAADPDRAKRMEEQCLAKPDQVPEDLGELYDDCEQSLMPNWSEPVLMPDD